MKPKTRQETARNIKIYRYLRKTLITDGARTDIQKYIDMLRKHGRTLEKGIKQHPDNQADGHKG